MTLKHQKDIRLINNCDAIYDEDLLKKAILWYSATPVQQSKKIFLYGNYAAVSIGRDKIHVHRLIGLYLIGRRRCNNHFHHINSNKMDNSHEKQKSKGIYRRMLESSCSKDERSCKMAATNSNEPYIRTRRAGGRGKDAG